MDRTEQQHRIRNLRARLRYRMTSCPRGNYHWPGRQVADWEAEPDVVFRQIARLSEAARRNDTSEYVRIWATLNHLKGE